jgi:hypothetical protein
MHLGFAEVRWHSFLHGCHQSLKFLWLPFWTIHSYHTGWILIVLTTQCLLLVSYI